MVLALDPAAFQTHYLRPSAAAMAPSGTTSTAQLALANDTLGDCCMERSGS